MKKFIYTVKMLFEDYGDVFKDHDIVIVDHAEFKSYLCERVNNTLRSPTLSDFSRIMESEAYGWEYTEKTVLITI